MALLITASTTNGSIQGRVTLKPQWSITANNIDTRNCSRLVTARSSQSSEVVQSSHARLATVEDVKEALRKQRVTLTIKELGPLYSIVCRDDVDGKILAATNGWVDPILKYMHCETLQVFKSQLKGKSVDRIKVSVLGFGLYLGIATMAYALSKGCARAEILAIKDDEYQHKKLVKYYKYFGFKVVKKVGDDLIRDVPDRIMWGGVGTRMDADPFSMLSRWSSIVVRDTEGNSQ